MGVPVTLELASGSIYTALPDGSPLVMLDKTATLEIAGPVTLDTTKPVAEVMAADVVALGLVRRDFVDALLTMNGKQWHVMAVKPNPSSFGESDGFYALELEGDTDD